MDALDTVAGWLRGAERILVLTGAGISAESGIPTFRGSGGLWEGFRAEELASPSGFAADPERVWRWYRWRRQACLEAQPNPAHHALVALERQRPELLLVTQNVDGLHRRAGSARVVELHGDIHSAWCRACGHIGPLPEGGPTIPLCPQCGARTRPRVLWFGENYWPGLIDRVVAAAEEAELALVIGTSGQVTVPAALAMHAQRAGAKLVDINPAADELSDAADAWIAEPAGKVLPELVRRAVG